MKSFRFLKLSGIGFMKTGSASLVNYLSIS